ncbi:MAG: competence type IV pilus major pilin ComGC [Janthinobacterium lividum]
MKFFRPNNKKTGFTLVEIMIVVLFIGILLAIAIPNFVAARESSRAKACVGNLKQIDSAKQQAAMDNKLSGNSAATFMIDGTTASTAAAFQLVGPTGYIRATPVCPSAASNYTVTTLGTVSVTPYCLASATSAGVATATGTSGATANYGVGEKFYHGLMN